MSRSTCLDYLNVRLEETKGPQAKIKEGSEASIEILDLTLEMMELASNPDTMEEAQEKMTELTEKMNSYSDQASKLTEGLTEVLGS